MILIAMLPFRLLRQVYLLWLLSVPTPSCHRLLPKIHNFPPVQLCPREVCCYGTLPRRVLVLEDSEDAVAEELEIGIRISSRP
jgi:hypothetical protein